MYAEKHKQTIELSLNALFERKYFTLYPESPKSYEESLDINARAYFSSIMNNKFTELKQSTEGASWIGEEISPYMQLGIGVLYPQSAISDLINRAGVAKRSWSSVKSIDERASILIETLERIRLRFFDITHATMHTTGQSYIMAFQASGPHSNDRALEAIAVGYKELTSYKHEINWSKPMGKFNLELTKTWNPISKGIGLVIGCSTFPIWNTVPGIYANLITGNSCIVKPHPKAVLPIAIVVAEIQKVLAEVGLDPHLVQLAPDTIEKPITKLLAENDEIKLIDYTGGSEFGSYIEALDKTVFTEKAGVNSIILDSVNEIEPVVQNISFSTSLYSGQMCTAPQNIFVSRNGVKTKDGVISFDEVVNHLSNGLNALVTNPKIGPSTLGAIQSDLTKARIKEIEMIASNKIKLASMAIKNEEFPDARTSSPLLAVLDKNDYALYSKECFGPIVFVIQTDGVEDSVSIAKSLASTKGALTCGAYTVDSDIKKFIAEEMNSVFTPVSFNFKGAALINSHAAFSDLHVTGGNPAGNASLTNSEFITKRFVWVGNRYME